jgi:hypothetical protein
VHYEFRSPSSYADNPLLRRYKIFLHDDLVIVWRRYSVRAVDLQTGTLAWQFKTTPDNRLHMYDCCKWNDRLCILNSPAGNRFEMMELDCATGILLDRTERGAFFEYGAKLGVDECYAFRCSPDSWLVLLSYKKPLAPRVLRLYAVDLRDKSVSPLIAQMAETSCHPDYQSIWPKPVLSDFAIFYRLHLHCAETPTSRLVARNVQTGDILWHTSPEPEHGATAEMPFLADGDNLVTVTDTRHSHRVTSRHAATGEIRWTADLAKFSPYSGMREMKTEDGILYTLSDYSLRALDAATGKKLWKTDIWGIARTGIWRRIAESVSSFIRGRKPQNNAGRNRPGEPVANLPPDTAPSMENVERFVRDGNDIAAIKAYRRIHGVGLADAKSAIDVMKENNTQGSPQTREENTRP